MPHLDSHAPASIGSPVESLNLGRRRSSRPLSAGNSVSPAGLATLVGMRTKVPCMTACTETCTAILQRDVGVAAIHTHLVLVLALVCRCSGGQDRGAHCYWTTALPWNARYVSLFGVLSVPSRASGSPHPIVQLRQEVWFFPLFVFLLWNGTLDLLASSSGWRPMFRLEEGDEGAHAGSVRTDLGILIRSSNYKLGHLYASLRILDTSTTYLGTYLPTSSRFGSRGSTSTQANERRY